MNADTYDWPELPLQQWKDTYETLHRWVQIVGKIRVAQCTWINHGWHATLRVSSRGLTTTPVPHGKRTFEVTLDFNRHELHIDTSDGQQAALDLRPLCVADFHDALLDRLDTMGLPVFIHGHPNELEDVTPFKYDRERDSYDPDAVSRLWRILVQTDRIFKDFRARYAGKCSPVQFFWGSFDLAVTRFSGRPAPPHPGGFPNMPDAIVREAYSHELSSCGFWPGGGPHPFPLFYSYAYPEPDGFASARVDTEGAFYSKELQEWVLPYDVVREADSPDDVLLSFLQSTYDAASGDWNRPALDFAGPPASRDGTRSRLSQSR